MLDKLKPVFRSFETHEVKYLVIGGIAAILHGVPRLTFDLDVVIEPSVENAKRLLAALFAVGFNTASLTTPEEILSHEITIFDDLERIDVQTRTPGIDFQSAWNNRETVLFEGQSFYVLSRPDLIASKRAAGRPVDLDDIRCLEAEE